MAMGISCLDSNNVLCSASISIYRQILITLTLWLDTVTFSSLALHFVPSKINVFNLYICASALVLMRVMWMFMCVYVLFKGSVLYFLYMHSSKHWCHSFYNPVDNFIVGEFGYRTDYVFVFHA